MQKPDICIYHSPCPDGFTSAWAVYMKWPKTEFFPAGYGAAPPDVTGKHVLIVDFSYPRETLEEMLGSAASITILDHHKTAQAELEPLLKDGSVLGEFDMTRSGAMMTWQYCWPKDVKNPFDIEDGVQNLNKGYIPWLVRYIQDRDLWEWNYEDTKAILAYAGTLPCDFETWTTLAFDLEDHYRYEKAYEIGTAINKKYDLDVAAVLRATRRRMVIGGYDVPCANLPHFMSSEAGNIMAIGEPFSASYFDNAKGDRNFSLRSDNKDPNAVDVSAIAKLYGGGGHFHASGFKMPLGWEGDKRD